MDSSEPTDRDEEPTVPQYQIHIENLDFKLKELKGTLFILEQDHTQAQVKINSKIESAKRALEKPMKDLENAKNCENSDKNEEIEKTNEQIKKIDSQRQKSFDKINKLEENLALKYNEENEKYERMQMLENDIFSTELEKKKMEEEIPTLDKKTESIVKTYPNAFKKLTDDFILFDKKSRIEVNIKEIENKIILQNYKVKEFKNIKENYDNLSEQKQGNKGDVELKLKLNEKKQNDIDNLVSSLTQSVNKIIQIETFFPMFDSYFESKNYIENKTEVKTIKNYVIPFINQLLEKFNEMNNEQIEKINLHEKEISDLNDVKPATIQIKRDIKQKKNELKDEKTFSNYLTKLITLCESILEIYKPYESAADTDCVDNSAENEFFEKIREILLLSAEGNKEDIEKNLKDYLELKEEKNRDYINLMGGSKDALAECDNVKKESNRLNDMVIRHQNQIEKFNKEKKVLQDELKALNDTINLRSRELKASLNKFTEEQFSEYFNKNKDLLKILLYKEKKTIVKSNQYELTKENIKENILIDHSRKKTNMYIYLKRKHLLEYLCHLYSEDNLDLRSINERTKKAYTDLVAQINNSLNEINKIKEEINNFDDKIQERNSHIEDTNSKGNNKIEQLNYKVQALQKNITALESEKYQETMEFENKKYGLMEEIKRIKDEIDDLEGQLEIKLNNMTCGVVNLYLKYDNNTRNFNPEKDKFNPSIFGYALKEFDFQPEKGVLLIKDMRNKIIEKRIKYDMIKRISLDADSVKLVNDIETKYYKDEKEKNKDINLKKKIKLFVILRRSNLDLVAKEYQDYKKFVDIVNSIIIHK